MTLPVQDAPRVHEPVQAQRSWEPLWRSIVAGLILGAIIALLVRA
jgi:hypothetical protein